MFQENVEILRRGIEALNGREVEVLSELVHDEAEWRPALTAGGALERTVYRGPGGIAEYLDDLEATFADTRFHVESLDPIGSDRVFFRGRVTAEGRASGVPLDVPIWAIWEVRDRKVLRGVAFLNKDEALEAAGLRG